MTFAKKLVPSDNLRLCPCWTGAEISLNYISCEDGVMIANTGYTGFAVTDNESDFIFLVGCGKNWMVLISCLNKNTPGLAIFHDLVPITIDSEESRNVGWYEHKFIFLKNSRNVVNLEYQNERIKERR